MKQVLRRISLALLLLAAARLDAQSNSQSAQAAFRKDAAQLSALQAKGNLRATQYTPCVQTYQQALPHVVNESKYCMQNNSRGVQQRSRDRQLKGFVTARAIQAYQLRVSIPGS